MAGLEQALERVGGTTKLAIALGIRSQAISQWKTKGRVPANRVLDVERITGVHRHLLNPTIYPEPPVPDAGSVAARRASKPRAAA